MAIATVLGLTVVGGSVGTANVISYTETASVSPAIDAAAVSTFSGVNERTGFATTEVMAAATKDMAIGQATVVASSYEIGTLATVRERPVADALKGMAIDMARDTYSGSGHGRRAFVMATEGVPKDMAIGGVAVGVAMAICATTAIAMA